MTLGEILSVEIDTLSNSYLNNTIEYIKWTTTISLAALVWIGNEIKGTSGEVRLWLVVSVLLLAISFLASISVFFLILFSQSAAVLRKIFHKYFSDLEGTLTTLQKGLRDKLITDLCTPHKLWEILVFQGLLGVHFTFLICGLGAFVRAMIIS